MRIPMTHGEIRFSRAPARRGLAWQWKLTDPCQQPVESAAPGQWWAPMNEVFHLD